MSKVSLKHGTKTLLMVEGKHEVDFFEALMKTRCIPQESFQVMDLAGKNNLAINLKTIKNDPEFHGILSLGIVRDADYLLSASPDRPPYSSTAAESAFRSVRDTLKNLSLPEPSRHSVITGGPLRTGIFIMPDGASDGMLESLCHQAVDGEPGAKCVDLLFECAGSLSISPKAWTHAYIAIQNEPDLPFGKAALSGYWNLHHVAFDEIATFLNNLISPIESAGE